MKLALAAPRRSAIVAGMDHRETRVEVRTHRDKITGTLRLPRDTHPTRLTDYLNAGDRSFLPLSDAEITPMDRGHEPERRAVVVVSLSQIVLAIPTEAESEDVASSQ